MDSTQLAFVSMLVGFESLPNLKFLFTSQLSTLINWHLIDTFIIPIYFIVMGLLVIFQKVHNDKFITYPLLAFLAYRGFIKKYLL